MQCVKADPVIWHPDMLLPILRLKDQQQLMRQALLNLKLSRELLLFLSPLSCISSLLLTFSCISFLSFLGVCLPFLRPFVIMLLSYSHAVIVVKLHPVIQNRIQPLLTLNYRGWVAITVFDSSILTTRFTNSGLLIPCPFPRVLLQHYSFNLCCLGYLRSHHSPYCLVLPHAHIPFLTLRSERSILIYSFDIILHPCFVFSWILTYAF